MNSKRRAGAIPRLCANLPFYLKMPPLGTFLPYSIFRSKGQAQITHMAFLTQRLSGNHHPLNRRPLAFPINGFRGVHSITSYWYAIRFRIVHRSQSRFQDLFRVLSSITSSWMLRVNSFPR